MGNRPIPTKKFKKWLKSKGLEFKRQEASHEIWDYPDESLPRPIVFRGKKPDIPSFHIKTNLKTLGISYSDFEKEIQRF